MYENFGLVHAGAKIVDAGRVDDHDLLSSNHAREDADFASARLKSLADLLLLRSDEVDELFGI